MEDRTGQEESALSADSNSTLPAPSTFILLPCLEEAFMFLPQAASPRKLELSLTLSTHLPESLNFPLFLLFSDARSGHGPSSLGSQCHGYAGVGHPSNATINRNWWDAVAAVPSARAGGVFVVPQAYSSPVTVNCLAGGSLVLHVSIGVDTN